MESRHQWLINGINADSVVRFIVTIAEEVVSESRAYYLANEFVLDAVDEHD